MQKWKISSNFISGKLIKKGDLMRTVLITGVSTGIGKSIAIKLLENNSMLLVLLEKQKMQEN